MAAVIKCNIRRYINEKHNVENSKEFIDAAKTTKYVSLFASIAMPNQTISKSEASSKKIQWTRVTQFNNLEYEVKTNQSKQGTKSMPVSSNALQEIEVTARRSYNIGTGKEFIWSKLNTVKNIDSLIVTYESCQNQGDWMSENSKGTHFQVLYLKIIFISLFLIFQSDDDCHYQSDIDAEEEEKDNENKEIHLHSRGSTDLFVFDCPDSNCIRQFRRYSELQAHLVTGKHKYAPMKLKLLDKAKLCYKDELENGMHQHMGFVQNFIIIRDTEKSVQNLNQGWALFNRKSRKRLLFNLLRNIRRY